METVFRIGSLCADCVETFNRLIEEAKLEPFYSIITQEKHTND